MNPSAAYYQKEKLDLDSWFKVTQIDYERLIEQYPPAALFDFTRNLEIRLLDLGCGTARFPCLLDKKMPDRIHVHADLLDISEYCLDSAVAQYHALRHFSPAVTYLSAIEYLPQTIARDRSFDVIWAIHSLCTVNRDKLADICRSCLRLLRPNGKFFIYQLARNSSYYRLYDYYLVHHSAPNNAARILASEDHQQVLMSLAIDYEIHKIKFTHTIDVEQRHLLAVYLKKCIMDNDPDVLEFFQPVLNEHLDSPRAQYRFDQEVDLLIIDKGRNIGAPVA
ncbi:class I SAM-dependent methyltransferase [uncultured Thiodictyon sp.]|uniref:class I SAM-dependent methyltransferase n=1 Tax=uncultured Thiodictyon sp. TaxID=1846217 RepID=UPI0034121D8F